MNRGQKRLQAGSSKSLLCYIVYHGLIFELENNKKKRSSSCLNSCRVASKQFVEVTHRKLRKLKILKMIILNTCFYKLTDRRKAYGERS